MNNLLYVCEIYSNGYRGGSVDVTSIASAISGILVIISKNPVVCVMFLICLFLCIACYLVTLGVSFIGLSYLLVYVGAVSILFLFILMLINVRVSELLSDTSKSIPLALITSVLWYSPVSDTLPFNSSHNYSSGEDISYLDHLAVYFSLFFSPAAENSNYEKIMYVTSKLWDGNLAENTHIASIGNIMYSSYSIWLILTSIILLLAMVGSIVITIKQEELS